MLFSKRGHLLKSLTLCVCLGFLYLSTYSSVLEAACRHKDGIKVLGLIESITIHPVSSTTIQSIALLDTGATHSVIHARNITMEQDRTGQSTVSFDIKDARSGSWKTIHRPFLRYARIKTHHGEPVKRIVVSLPVRVGDITGTSEFYLMNRQAFKYPALLGRSFLKDRAVVDASRQHLASHQFCMDVVNK